MSIVELPISSIFFLTISCSSPKNKFALPSHNPIKPSWFEDIGGKRILGDEGELLTHPFFDGKPPSSNFNTSGILDAYILNYPGDKLIYGVELTSGKKFAQTPQCKQKDVWGKYDDLLDELTFHIGFIPRILTPSGQPYPIFIFGETQLVGEEHTYKYHGHEVRIIGGVNLQSCPKVSCRGTQWKNNIIPIAVFTKDKRMLEVKGLEDLGDLEDLKYFYSYIQNYQGRIIGERNDSPAFKLMSTLGRSETIQMVRSMGHEFTSKRLFFLKSNCSERYEKIWNQIVTIREKRNKKNSLKGKL